MKKITIVTVTYNCLEPFCSTLKSVLEQDYSDYEYIVIDGGSTDGTWEKILSISDHLGYFVSEKDKGIYDAMNKAIAHATGEWIFFLNAGDLFYSSKTLYNVFQNDLCNHDVVFGDRISRKKRGDLLIRSNRPFYASNHQFISMGFSHQCVFVRSSWTKRFPFDLSYKCCADFNMIHTIYQKGGHFLHIDEIISIVEGREGYSQNHKRQQRLEEARIIGIDRTIRFKIFDVYLCLKSYVKTILN